MGHQKGGVYTVKEGFQQLCSRNPTIGNWPRKLIWRTTLPPKVVCFTWKTLYEAYLTQDNIKTSSQTDAICAKKRFKPQTPFSSLWGGPSELWSMLFGLSGLNWITPLSVKDAYGSWSLWSVWQSHQEDLDHDTCLFILVYLVREEQKMFWWGVNCFKHFSLGLPICLVGPTFILMLMQNNFRTLNKLTSSGLDSLYTQLEIFCELICHIS